MLKDLGVDIVILGHSERRSIYKETNETINKKVKLALKHDLTVDLCIGETLEEREAGKAEAVCFEQLEKGLAGISEEELANIVIAYEPVWAIGTGKTASPEDAEAVHKACRGKLAQMYSQSAADKVIIQYGGSVKPANVKELMAMENIDGGLIGGASLTADSFAALANFNK
jgi:triosephosphate isomerase